MEILEETLEPFVEDMQRIWSWDSRWRRWTSAKACYWDAIGEREGGEGLGWASDFPAEAAGNALQVWLAGDADPQRRDTRRKERAPLPPDFLSLVPKWIPMIERLWKP